MRETTEIVQTDNFLLSDFDLPTCRVKTTIGSVFVQLTYSIFSALCTIRVITSSDDIMSLCSVPRRTRSAGS